MASWWLREGAGLFLHVFRTCSSQALKSTHTSELLRVPEEVTPDLSASQTDWTGFPVPEDDPSQSCPQPQVSHKAVSWSINLPPATAPQVTNNQSTFPSTLICIWMLVWTEKWNAVCHYSTGFFSVNRSKAADLLETTQHRPGIQTTQHSMKINDIFTT